MKFQENPIADALSAAYFDTKINKTELQQFEAEVQRFVSEIDDQKSEEYIKNQTSALLKNTLYSEAVYHINTDNRTDLVIRDGKTSKHNVAVLLEFKRLKSPDMVRKDKFNTKALHEIVWYYMQEREHNVFIKHLIITNGADWFVFKAADFETIFYKNKDFYKAYSEFKHGLLSQANTDHFYKEIAQPFIEKSEKTLSFVYFNLGEINLLEEKKYAIFKFLHPQHLLKQAFQNDSNSLNRPFYDELLHLLGLHEVKDGGIKRIQRKPEYDRQEASLLENTIDMLESEGIFKKLNTLGEFGTTESEQVESIALELCITWLNRMLFMKLLEGQLMNYHRKTDKQKYAFMHYEQSSSLAKPFDFDQLNQLFFKVMAVPQEARKGDVRVRFGHLPYLNSALFERTHLEDSIMRISNLTDGLQMPMYGNTVLKDAQGKRQTGSKILLHYLLDFLNAYNFAAASDHKESANIIQTDNKNLINASVLGLVFEKLNGYRDGSFFTPGFVTMYMCRETVRAATIQKFNTAFGWNTTDIESIANQLERQNISDADALKVLQSLRICDPAVGSGHFLVSALNELLLIQKELFLLKNAEGKTMRGYQFSIDNDELLVQFEGKPLEYMPDDDESARMQAALFEAKRAFIENCLFGVDINPKSVAICQLRLWIELLKNAYYKAPAKPTTANNSHLSLASASFEKQLQTLPNIDINIKTGNSLVHKVALNENLSHIFSQQKYTAATYLNAVNAYKQATDKDEKQAFAAFLQELKTQIRTVVFNNNPLVKELSRLRGQLNLIQNKDAVGDLFGKLSDQDFTLKASTLEKQIAVLAIKEQDYRTGAIYRNAFEWRFDFPEILDENGEFVGFDAVVGNPPYIQLQSMPNTIVDFYKTQYQTFARTGDIYGLFFERGMSILKKEGTLHFIVSNKWMRAEYGRILRKFFLEYQPLQLIDLGSGVFDNATVDTNTLFIQKTPYTQNFKALDITKEKTVTTFDRYKDRWLLLEKPTNDAWIISSGKQNALKIKMEKVGEPLKEWDIQINRGILTGYNEAFIIDTKTKELLCAHDPKCAEIIKPILRGRDIKKYSANWADLWLIATYNGELVADKNIIIEKDKTTHYFKEKIKIPIYRTESRGGYRSRVNRIVVETDYPIIYKYLQQYQPELEKRGDKGEHWTNLRNCAYHEEFEKEKIVFKEMVMESSFAYDIQNTFCLDTGRIITGKDLKYLLAILNSKLFFYSIKNFYGGGGLGELGVRMKHTFFEHFPTAVATPEQQAPIIALVEEILVQKARDTPPDTTALEREIDRLVYALYTLTDEEIAVVEG